MKNLNFLFVWALFAATVAAGVLKLWEIVSWHHSCCHGDALPSPEMCSSHYKTMKVFFLAVRQNINELISHEDNCMWQGLLACLNTHMWSRLLLCIIGYLRGLMLSLQKTVEELNSILLSLAYPLICCLGNCYWWRATVRWMEVKKGQITEPDRVLTCINIETVKRFQACGKLSAAHQRYWFCLFCLAWELLIITWICDLLSPK